MAIRRPKQRLKARNALADLRASGAVAATFHPDGSIASVAFPPPTFSAPAVEAKPGKSALPFDPMPPLPKTDLDVLTELPSFENDQGAAS